MKKATQNLADMSIDALLGYAVVILSIVCFMLALWLLTAGIRLLVGLGQ